MRKKRRFHIFNKENIFSQMFRIPPLAAMMIIVGLSFLSSCATKTRVEYRDRDVIKHETKFVHDTLKESVHDVVFHTIYVNGDTVYNTKYVEKTNWRDRIIERHDTCWRDSVVMEYKETVKEVTKIPKIYKISLFISIICIIFAFIKLVRWLQIR